MKKLFLMLAALAALAFAGTASAQYAPVTVPQVYVNPTVDCPVVREDLRAVLSGAYGVDGLSRPVNANGFPVDTAGNCLIDRPVTQVFYARPAPLYVDFLWAYFAYRWMMPVYRPIFTPGVVIMHSRPVGVIVPMRTYVVPSANPRVTGRYMAPSAVGQSTTVRPGAAVTVRPGAPAAVGPATTVRPPAPPAAGGAVRPPAAAPVPTRIAPAAAPPVSRSPSVFNRGPAVAPTRVAPTRIAPSSTGRSSSSGFRRGR